MTDTHADRARAESFGSAAEQYDRHRPWYPAAFVDDVVALRPGRVLDVGCGTGRVARALIDRGLPVLGVEVDERMAAVARGHGVEVEVAAFETWDDAGRRFDLITCGQAWHWIDPQRGTARAAELLRSGGSLVLVWNGYTVDDTVAAVFADVYGRHAPQIEHTWRPGPDSDPTFDGGAAFEPAELRRYRWDVTLTVPEWIALVATVSDHLRLDPAVRAALFDELSERLGVDMVLQYQTVGLFARRK